jgi:hypothetical protein
MANVMGATRAPVTPNVLPSKNRLVIWRIVVSLRQNASKPAQQCGSAAATFNAALLKVAGAG